MNNHYCKSCKYPLFLENRDGEDFCELHDVEDTIDDVFICEDCHKKDFVYHEKICSCCGKSICIDCWGDHWADDEHLNFFNEDDNEP